MGLDEFTENKILSLEILIHQLFNRTLRFTKLFYIKFIVQYSQFSAMNVRISSCPKTIRNTSIIEKIGFVAHCNKGDIGNGVT